MSALVGHIKGRRGLDAGAPDDLLPCPNCSLRSQPLCRPWFVNGRSSGAVILMACCPFSRKGIPIVGWPRNNEGRRIEMTEGEENSWRCMARILLANWWRVRRLTGKAEMLQWLRDNRGITPAMEELA